MLSLQIVIFLFVFGLFACKKSMRCPLNYFYVPDSGDKCLLMSNSFDESKVFDNLQDAFDYCKSEYAIIFT